MENKKIKVEVCIEGKTPLIHNRANPKLISGEIKEKELKPKEVCELKVYRKEGKYCVPDSYILGMFKNAIRSLGLGLSRDDKKLKEILYTSVAVSDGNTLVGDYLIPIETEDYEEFASVVSADGKGGSKIIRFRPKFNKWKTKFILYVDMVENAQTDKILDKIKTVLENGGKNVGIGDGREINAGRFIVNSFKRL